MQSCFLRCFYFFCLALRSAECAKTSIDWHHQTYATTRNLIVYSEIPSIPAAAFAASTLPTPIFHALSPLLISDMVTQPPTLTIRQLLHLPHPSELLDMPIILTYTVSPWNMPSSLHVVPSISASLPLSIQTFGAFSHHFHLLQLPLLVHESS